jgi:hypothetical protein
MVYQAINVALVLPAVILVNMYPQFAEAIAGIMFLILGVCWQLANRRLGMLARMHTQ